MALTRVSRHIIDEPFNPTTVSATDVTTTNINASGIGTVGTLRVTGDLTVEGTTTTLDSILTEVDRLEVSANSTVAAGIITQAGSGDGLLILGGNVGIGTDNARSKLDIQGSDAELRFYRDQGDRFGGLRYTGSLFKLRLPAADHFTVDDSSNNERLRITSTGYVGINETTPTNRLHVKETNSNTIVGRLESSVEYSYLSIEDNSTTTGNVRVGAHGNDLVMNAGAVQRLRITSDGKVRVPDNGKFVVGDGDDLQIYHDGSTSYIKDAGVGNLNIETNGSAVVLTKGQSENLAKFIVDGAAELYYDNSKKLETSSTGISVTGQVNASTMHLTDGNGIHIGNSNDLRIFHDGAQNAINSYTVNPFNIISNGDTTIKTNNNDNMAVFKKNNAVELYYDNSLKLQTANGGVNIVGNINLNSADNYEIRLGANNDLKLYHNATDSYIDNATGDLHIRANGDDMILRAADNISIMPQNGENGINVYGDGPVDLYYDNDHKFQTTATGAKVLGALEVTQEYPSIRPTLDLNFAATKTLDRRITFTRDSIGTYIDENGLVKYASNNVPRFDHDPTTHESFGLLVEENRTNDARNSSDFSSTRSASAYGDKSTVNTNVTTAPDGTLTADQIVTVASSTQNRLAQTHSVTNGSYYTYSVFIKYDNLDNVQFYLGYGGHLNTSASFTFSTESISGGGGTAAFVKYPNGWYRISFTGQAFSTGSAYSGFISGTTANLRVYVWGEQIEVGSFPTSYIPTGSSAVTRDDDDAVIKGTNFSDIYNETEGTIFAEFNTKVNSGGTSKWAVSLKDPANNNNYIAVKTYAASMQVLQVQSGGSTVVNLSVDNSVVIDQFRRVAASFKVNDFDGADGGTLLTGDTSGAMPTGITQMDIGRGWTNSDQKLEGHIKSIKYYRTKLPDAQLQGLTQQ